MPTEKARVGDTGDWIGVNYHSLIVSQVDANKPFALESLPFRCSQIPHYIIVYNYIIISLIFILLFVQVTES